LVDEVEVRITMTTDSVPKNGCSRTVYAAVAAVSLGGFVFGYNFAVIAGAIFDIRSAFDLSSAMTETIVSAGFAGAIFGAVLGGRIADRLGRRSLLMVIAVVFAAGSLTTAIAPTVAWLIAGRVVVGIAIGMVFVGGPLFISEVSPESARGRLVAFNALAISIGVLFAYLADFLLETSGQWRIMLGLGAIPAVAGGLAVLFLPDTPHWYMARRMRSHAHRALTRFRVPGSDIEAELCRIEKSAGGSRGGWNELTQEGTRSAIFVGTGLAAIRAITGMTIVTVYAPTILNMADFASPSIDMLATVGLGVLMLVSRFAAMKLIDRLGRKPLLLIGLVTLVFGFLALGLIFLAPSNLGGGVAVLVCLAVLGAAFNISTAPVVPVLLAEIYPLRVRALAMSISTVAMWISYIVVSATFLTLLNILGPPGTFWFFAAVNLAAAIFVYRSVPETKGQSLEAIGAQWLKKSG
jgi:sugar porter (SP) family MFS transporter